MVRGSQEMQGLMASDSEGRNQRKKKIKKMPYSYTINRDDNRRIHGSIFNPFYTKF